MLYLRSAYRCARHIEHCRSQILLDSFNIGPMTMIELNNLKYIEQVSDLMIKYFTPTETPIKHEKKVLEKWKAEDSAQYEKARNNLTEVKTYLKANPYAKYVAQVQRDWEAKRQKA